MTKEILVAVLASLATAASLWFIGVIGNIPSVLSVPSGAVIAFNSESCPEGDWREYKLAHGRFIRGIDHSGDNIDPGGKRKAGSIQGDILRTHAHTTTVMVFNNNEDGLDSTTTGSYEHRNAPRPTEPSGGVETRPINVALLYCEKI